jgi:hypothetical protein
MGKTKIEEIARRVTPVNVKEEIKRTNRIKLPPELQKWVEGYKRVGGERNEFIWKWVYIVSKTITLSSAEKKYQKSLWEIKFLMIMFVVLIDDMADKYKNRKMLEELVKIPFNQSGIRLGSLKREDREFIAFTVRLWNHIERTYKKYPRYKEFEDIIEFDLKQLLNAMEYAYLVNNHHNIINKTEYRIYFSHNMQLIIDIMFDLSCSSKFDAREMGKVREISDHAQLMARIGNWISTWEREIGEEDFTSAVFAYALENGTISAEEMTKNNKEGLIKKIRKAGIEDKFLKEWENNYQEIKKSNRNIKSVKVADFLNFLEKIIFMHLTSKGYK